MKSITRYLAPSFWLVAAATASAAGPQGDDTPAAAQRVLKQYCYKCHGATFKVPGFDVSRRESLLAAGTDDETRYVVPGKPEDSLVWQRVGVSGEMPPKRQPQPSAEDKAVLKAWIASGASFPAEPRPVAAREDPGAFQGDEDVLKLIRDFLRDSLAEDRAYKRFFTLTVPYNLRRLDKSRVKPLPYYRAALSKLVNSLSVQRDIVLPVAVDRAETVYVVDLRDLGWDEPDLWREILKTYPYGLIPRASDDAFQLHNEVTAMADVAIPYIRADWFIANASRPPLYNTMLRLPATVDELETRLGVDAKANFLRNRSARAGFLNSGVSRQNRLVERHRTASGAYWKSFDFANNNGERDLLSHPLGPVFDTNPFAASAFRHDGGEIIFNLPNGFQAYFLTNGKGQRLDKAPTEIVEDRKATAGSDTIVTGLSCMGCHRQGTIGGFKDEIRDAQPVGGDERRKVTQLHPTPQAFDELLSRDRRRFVSALEEATAPFLKADPALARDLGKTDTEVISAVAEDYLLNLNADQIAVEQNRSDLGEWKAALAVLAQHPELGLAPLRSGAQIPRAKWDSIEESGLSLYQEVARTLNRGTPRNVR